MRYTQIDDILCGRTGKKKTKEKLSDLIRFIIIIFLLVLQLLSELSEKSI